MVSRWCLLSLVVIGSAQAADHAVALELYRERRYAEAQQRFEAAVAEHDQDPVAHHHLGKLAQLRQDLPMAITHLEKALALAPDNAAINFDYGAVCSLHADTLGMSFRAAHYARRGRVALERAV
ncbi:MAG TPA: tetratricopeptide repeat protein, partial [Candidatus Synoicihabitans sp.]|nr:tetratricopeptide repeat protein [Candidatus Synoicihabitans sp.]